MYKLDSKPYSDSVKKAGEAAARVLQRYGEPTMSLVELRNRVARELGRISLADLILKEREARYLSPGQALPNRAGYRDH